MSLFDIDIKQDGDKVVFDLTNETIRLMRGFHANLERLCKEDFDRFAAANGYVKLEPGQCVVQAELLEAVIADMRNDCDCSDGYCNNECGGGNCHVKDLTAALDASEVGK